MLVVYKGKGILMTDYNGKRYCFEKDKTVDIPDEVYNSIVLSEHVDALGLQPVKQEINPEEKPAPKIETAKPEIIKKKIKPKKR